MADSDDIKPTQPIYPSRPLTRRQGPPTPPESETDKDEQEDERRRKRGGHKGRNFDDYA